MEKVFDLRFIVPPLITMILVGVFISLVCPNGILFFLVWFEKFQSLAVIIGSVGILALGFLISSITTFFINKNPIRKILGRIDYNDKEQENLEKKYPWIREKFTRESFESDCACETAEWQILKEEGEYIQKQITKKWDMAMANFNSCIAIVFSLFIGILIFIIYLTPCHISCRFLVFIVISIFILLIFWNNGVNAYKKVFEINKFLARKPNNKSDRDG